MTSGSGVGASIRFSWATSTREDGHFDSGLPPLQLLEEVSSNHSFDLKMPQLDDPRLS